MAEILDWAKDLLVSRGALVETEEAGSLRAMLSPELAQALGASEWLSLRFGAGAGSDDDGEWLERLGHLLPPDARVVGARLRRPRQAPAVDAGSVLDRELGVQNGIYRLLDDRPETARHYFFNFQYTIESDETSLGAWTVCLNPSARSLVHQPESLLSAVRDNLEEDPEFAIPREELAQLFPMALRAAQPEIRRLAAATRLDRAAKLDDLARKYSLRIRVEPGDVLVVPLPVLEITARLIRKKAERVAKLHWNPALGALESPWCESCFGRAHPLFLCDDRVHCVCKSCLTVCPNCGKQFCRACQPKCRCGAAAGTENRRT